MAMEDEVLEFNFEGVTPVVAGSFVAMPRGEYTLQCIGVSKFYAKNKEGPNKGEPNPNKPGLHFSFLVTMHPTFEGKEMGLWHMLGESNMKFLLNTLMVLVPGFDWNKNGLK